MPDGGVRRETERSLVAGSWDAVEPDNFRVTFPDERMARDYVFEVVGFRQQDTFLYAILRLRFDTFNRITNRKGWDQLSAQTRHDYEASRAAQLEAQYHQMTVRQWYEVAPDLKAFRRKAQGRSGPETVTNRSVEFAVYIARKYREVIDSTEGAAIGRHIREQQRKQAERLKDVFAQTRFGR